jgi:hypothetical protein
MRFLLVFWLFGLSLFQASEGIQCFKCKTEILFGNLRESGCIDLRHANDGERRNKYSTECGNAGCAQLVKNDVEEWGCNKFPLVLDADQQYPRNKEECRDGFGGHVCNCRSDYCIKYQGDGLKAPPTKPPTEHPFVKGLESFVDLVGHVEVTDDKGNKIRIGPKDGDGEKEKDENSGGVGVNQTRAGFFLLVFLFSISSFML